MEEKGRVKGCEVLVGGRKFKQKRLYGTYLRLLSLRSESFLNLTLDILNITIVRIISYVVQTVGLLLL